MALPSPGDDPPAPEAGEQAFVARWMALGLLLILVAAVRSEGFHHPDEHFQVLELAGAKLGLTPWSALPWEYHLRMRPWLQPALYTLGARALARVGVQDPFAWALGFRLFSGLLAWLGLVGLALCAQRWLAEPATRRLAVRALVLTYFVPYLAVRTSAESLSTSCVVLALGLLVLRAGVPGPWTGLVAGALLGLGCGVRYASAVMVVSILAWFVVIGREPWRRLAWVALGMASALGLALLADRWGYGSWTLPVWNYVAHNFGEDVAAQRFGAMPWYGYLFILCRGPFPPLNLLVAGSSVVAWVRCPRHVLTWATAPLALVHCLIAHKELRFLFPIAMLAPVLVALGLGDVPWRRRWVRAVGVCVVAVDLLGLAAVCLLPAQPQVSFQRFAARHFKQGPPAFVATPFSPWVRGGLTMHFYGSPPELRPWPGGAAARASGTKRLDLVVFSWDAPPDTAPYVCRPLYRSVPEWLSRQGWPRWASTPPPAWDVLRCVF